MLPRRNVVRVLLLAFVLAVSTNCDAGLSPHSGGSLPYFGYSGTLQKGVTGLDEWKEWHGDWEIAGAAHGVDDEGNHWTELVFSLYSDATQVSYNFRIDQYIGPNNEWDWPPDAEFKFSWHTRKD